MNCTPVLWVLQIGEQRWFTEADTPLPPAVGQLVFLQPAWPFRVDEVRTASFDVWSRKAWHAIAIMRMPESPEWGQFIQAAGGWEVLSDQHAARQFV